MTRVLALITATALLVATTARAASERELGRRFMLQARAALPLVDDPAVSGVVERLGAELVAQLGPQEFDYRFFVVRHPALNAFAVPGGYIFVFSGLLSRAESEDELVGVLGHEIAHVHAHHHLRQQAAGQIWTAASLLGLVLAVVNPVLGAGAMAAAQTAQLKFSREFEQEADFLGVRISTDAGYDPRALAGFFQNLITEQRLNPAGVPPYMLSHPVTETRVTSVDSLIRAQRLDIPPNRPQMGFDLREAQALVRAMDQPSEVVIGRYQKRLEATPESPEARYLLGRVYQEIGQLAAARTQLEAVATSATLQDRIHSPLGRLYLALGEHDAARRHLDRHLARHPRDAWARVQLGRTLAALGDDDEARAEYQRAIRVDPESSEAHRLLGLALGRAGDEADGLYHLAVGAQLRGDLPEALRHYRRVAELVPEDDPRHAKIETAIEDLAPLVREQAEQSDRRLGATGFVSGSTR